VKFNLLVEDLINKFKPTEGKTVAILPGGFKPPHKGHFNALNYLLDEADSGVVFIGKGVRDNITAEQSKQIWDIYVKHLSKPVTVSIAEVSPIKSTYVYADEHKDENIIVGVGPEEDPAELKRYDFFKKHPETFPLVKIVNIPPMHDRISGTKTRQLINAKSADAVNYFVPVENGKDLLTPEEKAKIAKIVGI
jgi:nicotinamide mononucleotide adenylyltransferase